MKKILLITLLLSAVYSNAQCWESVSVGERHVIGIQTNGTLWSWGYNGDYGALARSKYTKNERIGFRFPILNLFMTIRYFLFL